MADIHLITFLQDKWPTLLQKLYEQSYLVGFSVLLALMIALPLGIFTAKMARIKNAILGFVSALWTIPSLALLAFFVPWLGIGVKPAIIVLSLYALLPILRNTVTGLEGVPAESIEAARGLGFTPIQRLWMVELPLALPVIVAGIRTAVSITVGVATLAAFIGAGGLGDFINQGLALNNSYLILLGAIPAAIMALVLDFIISRVEKALYIRRRRPKLAFRIKFASAIVIGMMFILGIGFGAKHLLMGRDSEVVVASKNFTEQIILGEMIAQLLEAKTKLKIVRKFNLGSTALCQAALLRGEIDMYPEYTGTAYLTVLHFTNPGSSQQVYQAVKHAYWLRYHLVWLPPFGYNNTQALAVRQDFAAAYHLKTISDLKPIENQLTIAAPAAFLHRPDGIVNLRKYYHLHFKAVKQMNPGLMYKAIAIGAVDVINAFSTDGRIAEYHLVLLRDNLHIYPPYDAALIVRGSVLKKHPEIKKALQPLFGTIDDKTMRHLNYEVDVAKKTPYQVARAFLVKRGLLD